MTSQDVQTQGNAGDDHEQRDVSFGADVTAKCIEITERFRSGVISKVQAILALQSAIPHDNEHTYLQALGAYMRVLDNFERIRERAIPGPNRPGEGDNEGREDDRNEDQDGSEGRDGGNAVVTGQNKRPRSRSLESDDGPTKRKIDTDAFAWVIRDGIDPPSLPPSLVQTQSILENFSRDLKLAKSSLLNSARLPQFPDSEWTNLIAGRAVDLDHVLAGQYSVAHDERRTEQFGNLEVIVGTVKPARIVDTHGKWVIAWDQAVDATTYVFPHRSSELRDYGRHITQLFASFPDSLHTRVIQYDRAVRIRVAQRRDLLLTEYGQFADLHVLWIQNAGGGGTRTGDSDRRTRNTGNSKRREACRRWNENRCPNSAAQCNYAHVCTKCRSNGHTNSECKQ